MGKFTIPGNTNKRLPVVAITTLYRPDPETLIAAAMQLSREVSLLCYVDNSAPEGRDVVDEIRKLVDVTVLYVPTSKNIGLAALNKGVEYAVAFLTRKGMVENPYILFMDQDSIPADGMVKVLLADYKRFQEKNSRKIAAVGPVHKDVYTGTFRWKIPPKIRAKGYAGGGLYLVKQLPTSGMLTRADVWKTVGSFSPELFLDLTDFEWCWRAAMKGFVVVKTVNTYLLHALGEGVVRCMGFPMHIPSVDREYWLFRNLLFPLSCRYAPPEVKLKLTAKILPKMFSHLLCFENRRDRLVNIIKGVRDGAARWFLSTNAGTQ